VNEGGVTWDTAGNGLVRLPCPYTLDPLSRYCADGQWGPVEGSCIQEPGNTNLVIEIVVPVVVGLLLLLGLGLFLYLRVIRRKPPPPYAHPLSASAPPFADFHTAPPNHGAEFSMKDFTDAPPPYETPP